MNTLKGVFILALSVGLGVGCRENLCEREPQHGILVEEGLRYRRGNEAERDTFLPAELVQSHHQIRLVAPVDWDDYQWRWPAQWGDKVLGTDQVYQTRINTALGTEIVSLQVALWADLPETCKENVHIEVLERDIEIAPLADVRSVIEGVYEGYDREQPDSLFRVTITKFPASSSYQFPIFSLEGLPRTCEVALTKLDVGYKAFTILMGDYTDFGCKGIQGIGSLNPAGDSLFVEYEIFFQPGNANRTVKHFIGKKI